MKIKYFKNGALDENTGVTLSVQEFDEQGNLTFGLMDINGKPNPGFLAEEISKEEYDKISEDLKNPNVPKGIAGLISPVFVEKEFKKHKEARDFVEKAKDADKLPQVKRKALVDKLTALGIDITDLKQALK